MYLEAGKFLKKWFSGLFLNFFYNRLTSTLSGIIFEWRNFRDFREFDLFYENKTRKNGQNLSRKHKIELIMQKRVKKLAHLKFLHPQLSI